jgi:tetratricopeptide (TPR) repeat protein
MKTVAFIAGFAAFFLASALMALWWSGRAVSQFEGQYPPLYAGIDSPGALLAPQNPNPRHFFEFRVDWPLLNISEPRTAWEYTQRGIYFQDEVGDMEAAMADYMRADELERERSCGPGLELVPGRACLQILRARLANIYLQRGEYDKAIEEIDFILEENPLAPGLHFELAEAYLGKGNIEKAIEEFEKELQNQPCHQATHFELGELLLEEGRINEGRAHLTEYLRQTLLHCDPFPYQILKARKLLTEHGGPLDISGIAEAEGIPVCPANLQGSLDQVLSIPESQLTARVGCNPVGTQFVEEENAESQPG